MRYAAGLVMGVTLVVLWNALGRRWLVWLFSRGD